MPCLCHRIPIDMRGKKVLPCMIVDILYILTQNYEVKKHKPCRALGLMETLLFIFFRIEKKFKSVFPVVCKNFRMIDSINIKISCSKPVFWIDSHSLYQIHHLVPYIMTAKTVKYTKLANQDGRVLGTAFGIWNGPVESIPLRIRKWGCSQSSIRERKGAYQFRHFRLLRMLSVILFHIRIETMRETHHL